MPRKTRASWGSNKPARRKGYRTLRYWADLHDGRGYMRHTMTVEGSKRDGDRKLAELRLLHGEDKPVPTLRECYENWYLPDASSRLSTSTMKCYTSSWNSKIMPRWGDMPVTDIRPLDVQEWLMGMTRSQAYTASSVMGSILDFPLRYEVIDRNPMSAKYRLPSEISKRDKGVYDLSASMAIMEACRGIPIEPAVLSALFASCRVGEALSPMAVEVVEERASNGMVAARFDLVRQMGNRGKLTDTLKTESSARPIIFVGKVAERMLDISRERRKDGLVWMCDNGCCEPMTQRVLNSEWRKFTEAHGIERHPFTNLRNSWRTYSSWELGLDEARLEKMMGHAGRGVTAQFYDRPQVQMLIDAVADAYERKDVLS